jgi:hypothetical protein
MESFFPSPIIYEAFDKRRKLESPRTKMPALAPDYKARGRQSQFLSVASCFGWKVPTKYGKRSYNLNFTNDLDPRSMNLTS